MNKPTTIVWFRRDLRLADNPALHAACDRAGAVLPVYIWAPQEEGDWPPGAASRWWIHHALASLDRALGALDSKLVVLRGPTVAALAQLIDESGADAVYWNRRYEPSAVKRDTVVKDWLKNDMRIEAVSFKASLLHEPWDIRTKTGGPYKVFTPFWNATQAMGEPDEPLPPPTRIKPPATMPQGDPLESLGLLPKLDWQETLQAAWTPGEPAAQERLKDFLNLAVRSYKDSRDTPAIDGTSMLSPRLAHGELSPRQVWHAVRRVMTDRSQPMTTEHRAQCMGFLREIGWREFGYHVLFHFPHTPMQPLQPRYADFPWDDPAGGDAKRAFQRWMTGRTGYPIIDAGLRQLWRDGWMHNRVRMIVASFLVKDLLISWEHGARWFWDTLVDADLASNTLGWQWAGGCGADAAPYFRVFNPITQGEKFDGDGRYVRKYVPELSGLPDRVVHHPWDAKPDTLRDADVVLSHAGVEVKYAGETIEGRYPLPIVDHAEARHRALEAFDVVKAR